MKNIIIYCAIAAFCSLSLVSCTPDKYAALYEVKNNSGETIYLVPLADENQTGQSKSIEHGSTARIKGIADLNAGGAQYFDLLFLEEPQIRVIKYYTYGTKSNAKWWYLENADDEGRQFFNAKFWTYWDAPLHNSGYTRIWTFTIEPEDLE